MLILDCKYAGRPLIYPSGPQVKYVWETLQSIHLFCTVTYSKRSTEKQLLWKGSYSGLIVSFSFSFYGRLQSWLLRCILPPAVPAYVEMV